MNADFDVAIIGCGPGGTPAAMQLAFQGKKVLLVEESGKLGGACLFIGCIPSKIIRHGADEYAAGLKYSASEKQSQESREAEWNQIKHRMKGILEKRSGAAMQVVNRLPGIKFVAGHAKFVSNNKIEIDEQDTGSKEIYTFNKAIIATGAHSFIPPFEGTGVSDVLTSEVLFFQEKLPETLLIVGGGPIGVEIAQMLARLGTKCTIIEQMNTVLYGVVEKEFVPIISDKLKKSGVDIYTSSSVRKIDKNNERFDVTFTDADATEHNRNFENVLVVTGKIPNVEDLGLDAAGVQYDSKGIDVDEYLETTEKGIYAAGDVIRGGPKFAHTATYETRIAVANIMVGNKQKVDFSKNSWVLFSEPEVAAVGYTEEQATKKGISVITGVYDYKIDAAAQVAGDPFGYLKFIVNKDNSEIVGIHICHSGASLLSGEAALIVGNRLTLKQVAQAIHPHPTMSEAFGVLAQKMLSGR